MVEPMAARKLGHGATNRGLVHADRAVRSTTLANILLRDLSLWERLDCFFGSRSWCISSLMLFHQLGDDPIESLLAIDCISMNATWWHAEQLKEVA